MINSYTVSEASNVFVAAEKFTNHTLSYIFQKKNIIAQFKTFHNLSVYHQLKKWNHVEFLLRLRLSLYHSTLSFYSCFKYDRTIIW